MSSVEYMELENLDIIIKEVIDFDKSKEDKYEKLFEDRVNDGIISGNTNFYDDEWIINIAGTEKTINFPNDIQMSKLSKLFGKGIVEFNLAYRSFIVLNINSYSSIVALNFYMKRITINNKEGNLNDKFSNMFRKFIEYIKIPLDKYELFEEMLENIIQKESDTRALPEFEDILKFSDIINLIVEKENIMQYKKYLLTIMWWKICSVLPLRPTEFLRTEFKCIYKENDEFYLKVRRSKAKTKLKRNIKNVSKIDEYFYQDIIAIDEKLFNFIQNYRLILLEEFGYKEQVQLFPVEIINETRIKGISKRKMNFDIITDSDLRANIEAFYNNIIKEKFGLIPINKYVERQENCIEKITPYDARHIAIINLIMIGTDILEVMYLAGHTSVNTAYNYFNHVKEFSRGYALGYSKKIKAKKDSGKNFKTNIYREKSKGREDFKRVLETIKGEKFIPKQVAGGYCHYRNIEIDKSICFKYERNHTLCEYFVADQKQIIEKEIDRIETQLDSDIKILMDLIKDMKGISKFNELYQTTSYKVSKSIQELSVLNEKLLSEE